MAEHSVGVTWYGHSNMLVEGDGVRVLFDPFFEGNRFAPDWRTIPRPDIIAVTHDHGDHLGQAVVLAKTTGARIACIFDLAFWFIDQGVPAGQILNHGSGWSVDGTVEEKGARLTMTEAVHSCAIGAPVGYVLQLPGGLTIYHSGDTALFGDMALIGQRFKLDVAMLPIGGTFTMDGEQAAKACALLGAKTAIPMHYATFPALAPTADVFVRALAEHAPACRALVLEPGLPVAL